MPEPAATRLESLDHIELVDHHCHGLRRMPLTRAELEADLTEATGSGRWHGSLFDTQAGQAVLRWCATLLDLPTHCDPDAYLKRRTELGVAEVDRRLVGSTGISAFVVDTGLLPGEISTPEELAMLTGGRAYEVVRLEALGESVVGVVDYADAFRTALGERAEHAVGAKSIAAYRGGLDLDPSRPSDVEVQAAADAWARAGTGRLTDPVLIRFGIWAALDLRLPLQIHVGYGDVDVDLLRCDPLHLTPLLHATADLGVPVMLLHTYPFHRHAGYLAQVFDHVFVDVGLAMQNVGTGADAVLRELLELAPFGSVLFSTDAFALPELYVTSTALFRGALARFLEEGVRGDAWSAADAERFARMICAGNARRAYALDR